MICQECNRDQLPSTLQKLLTERKPKSIFVRDVLRKKGNLFMDDNGGPGFSINNLLAGLFNIESNFQQPKAISFPKTEELRCPHCQLSFKEFIRLGKFGCSKCSETFNKQLDLF